MSLTIDSFDRDKTSIDSNDFYIIGLLNKSAVGVGGDGGVAGDGVKYSTSGGDGSKADYSELAIVTKEN